jgi:hypothetical protein
MLSTLHPIVIALELLENETNPLDIIDMITSEKVDPDVLAKGYPHSQLRQSVCNNGYAKRCSYSSYTGSKLAQLYESISIFDTTQVDTQGSTGNAFMYLLVQGNVVSNIMVPSV